TIMKLKSILSLTVMIVSFTLFSQVNKGKISYDIYFSSDDPNTSAFAERMEGSVLEITFMGEMLRSDMYAGEMMTTSTVSHKNKDTSLILLDGMMGKIAMKVTDDDMDEEKRLAFENRQIELV